MKYLDSLELLYIDLLRGKEKKGMRNAFCKKKISRVSLRKNLKNWWWLAHKKLFGQNRNEKLKRIMLTIDYNQDFVIVFHFNLITSYSAVLISSGESLK